MNCLEEIYDSYLGQLLKALANEAERNIAYKLFDVADPSLVVKGIVECDRTEAEAASVEARMFRRQSTRPTRFTLQALTSDLPPETGFSGFVVNGRLTAPTGVEILSRMNSYNSHQWEGKLSMDGD